MFTALRVPDDPSWRADPAYSFAVAPILISAYKRLRAGHHATDTYATTLPSLLAAQGKTMAPIQRQHLSYAIAQCWSALSEYPDAIRYLDDALALSANLDDLPGIAECAYLRGSTKAIQTAYADASVDFLLCLQALRDVPHVRSAVGYPLPGDRLDPSLELYALLGRASAEFILGHNDLTRNLLDEAAPFVQLAPNRRRERAILHWLRSLVFRWSGAPGLALPLAIEAAELLSLSGSPENQGRIHGIVADTALDLVEMNADTQPRHPDRSAYLRLATSSIDRSLALARAADDPGGEGLALLALARLRRVAKQHRARVSLIEDVARSARRHADIMLLSQVHIAMGHELAAQGYPDQAATRYAAAHQLLVHTDAHAIDLLAERALHNLTYSAIS